MTLSSPNYPKWYNADSVGCEWLISAPEGFIIALEFNQFHVSDEIKETCYSKSSIVQFRQLTMVKI